MTGPRWPRALRILTEIDHLGPVRMLALAAYGTDCRECDWRGPLRPSQQEAAADGVEHIAEGHR